MFIAVYKIPLPSEECSEQLDIITLIFPYINPN